MLGLAAGVAGAQGPVTPPAPPTLPPVEVTVPRDVAPTLRGDEQAVSLWRVDGGLRVLLAPADTWIGTPR